MSHTLAKQDSGEFQITFTVDQKTIKDYYQKALEKVSADVTVPGFRKGKAPLNKVEKQVDTMVVSEEAVNQMLPEMYAKALHEYKLNPIVPPQVRVVSMEEGQDWQFEATACEAPEVDLKDSLKGVKGLLKKSEIWTPDSGKDEKAAEGENQAANEEKQIEKILEYLMEQTEVSLPDILIKQETDKLMAQLLDQLEKLGLNLDQYLASTGKTAEGLRESYTKRATETLKIEFILAEITVDQKIEVTDEEIQGLIDVTPDEDMRKEFDRPQAKAYLRASLLKRKAVEWLLSEAK